MLFPLLSWNYISVTLVVGVITLLSIALNKYRKAIQRRLQQLDVLRMVRMESGNAPVSATMKQVELNPEFLKKCPRKEEYQMKMMSLGDYLSSLRPKLTKDQDLPDWAEVVIQGMITRALLKALGPKFGRAVLPILGTNAVQGIVKGLVGKVATRVTSVSKIRKGTVPLPLAAIPGLSQLNYKLQSRSDDKDSSNESKTTWRTCSNSQISLFRGGEVGFSPSFSEVITPRSKNDNDALVPNPFIISRHWDKAIYGMESLLVAASVDTKWKETPMGQEPNNNNNDQKQKQGGVFVYDAKSKAMKTPVPINERLLPDLHLGWGSALYTHTHQEILKNRLLSVLLNRLASNYIFPDEPPFQVKVDDSLKAMTRPAELIQALLDMGHTIESCVRSNITTFGMALCVKEKDDSWTNVPLAFFLHNGYMDKEGNEAYACMPHAGLNLEIRGGPLLRHCSIQHYIAIEGLCCWNSNHNPDVPWMQNVDCGEVMRGDKMIESIRTAAMEAVIFNATGARLFLPHGGYGLTGVCNDSAAMIQYALSGKVDVYPLTLNGRFTMENFRSAVAFRDKLLRGDASMKKEINAVNRLIKAFLELPSDTNSLPSEAESQIRRQLHVQQPKLPFMLMRNNVDILSSIQKEINEALF